MLSMTGTKSQGQGHEFVDYTMRCCKCSGDVGELGGTQMTGCHHLLCLDCITEEAKKCSVERLRCLGSRGCFLCKGYLSQDVLVNLLDEETYAEYLYRVVSSEVEGAEGLPSSGNLKPSDLPLSEEEKDTGWAHKAAIVNNLILEKGMTSKEALEFTDQFPILETQDVISCGICLDDDVPAGEGVVLKDCLHMFCKPCLRRHIESTETAEVQCPFVIDDYKCDEPLKTSEIGALVDETEFRRHFEELSLREAESSMKGAFHCLTPNCSGFWIADENMRDVHRCEICRANNCHSCKILHRGTCEEYQQELADERNRILQQQIRTQQQIADERNRTQQQINDRMSMEEINRRLTQREYMRCPRCNVVIEKNQGCAHMKCRKCGHDFNWTGV